MKHHRHSSGHSSSGRRLHRRHRSSSRRHHNGAFSGTNAPQTGSGLCCIFAVLGELAFLVTWSIFKISSNNPNTAIPENALWFSSVPAILACAAGLYALLFRPKGKNAVQLAIGILMAVSLLILHLLELRTPASPLPPERAEISPAEAPTAEQVETLVKILNTDPAEAPAATGPSGGEKNTPVQPNETKAEDWYNGL